MIQHCCHDQYRRRTPTFVGRQCQADCAHVVHKGEALEVTNHPPARHRKRERTKTVDSAGSTKYMLGTVLPHCARHGCLHCDRLASRLTQPAQHYTPPVPKQCLAIVSTLQDLRLSLANRWLTHFLASWKIFSSSQSGFLASTSCARLLCSRTITVVMLSSRGFWLTLALPDSLHVKGRQTHARGADTIKDMLWGSA